MTRIKTTLKFGVLILTSCLLLACGSETATSISIAPNSTSKPAENLEPPLVKKWDYRAAKPDLAVRVLQLSPDNQTAFLLETNETTAAEVVALNLSSGQVKWRIDITSLIYDKAGFFQIFSLADNNTLYLTPLSSSGGLLMALDASNGTKKWEYKVDPTLAFRGTTIENQGENLFVAFETPEVLEVLKDKARTYYLVSINKKSGAKNWEFKTDDAEFVKRVRASSPGIYFTTSPPLLYLQTGDKLIYAIEPTSGKLSWKLSQSQTNGGKLLNAYKEGALVLVGNPPDLTKWEVRAVGVKDGATLWNVPLTTPKDELVAQGYFLSGENTLYLTSSRSTTKDGRLTSIDLAKGILKWDYSDPRFYASGSGGKDSVETMANQSYVYSFGFFNPGILVLDAVTGKPVWQLDDTNYFGLLATKETLYTATDTKLLGFSLATGKQTWSVALRANSRVAYRIQNNGDLVLFALRNGLLAYGRA